MKIEDINIGDRIYEFYMDYINRVLTVTRKTKKWIIAKDERLVILNGKIESHYKGNSPKCIYELETDELINRWDKQKIIRKIERSYWDLGLDKLSINTLNKFYWVIEDFKASILDELTTKPKDHS